MRPSRLLPALGFAVLLLIGVPMRPALAEDDPGAFIAKAADAVLNLLKDPNTPQAEFKKKLHEIADQNFDTPKIARFVLGPYWRTASEGDRQQFVQAFADYMVQVYSTRFRQYGGATFKVVGQRHEGNSTMVTTTIDQSGGKAPAKVLWQVDKGPNGLKITDVSIEGVSQALTYRQEFSSVISQNGGQVSALTQSLREKSSG